MAAEITTIKLRKSTADALSKLKIHPRQPYEEVILKIIGAKVQLKDAHTPIDFDSKKEITTIKLTKKTVEALSRLKIHPRQSYEEVILKLISENESHKKT